MKRVVIRDIFGHQIGDVYHKGLLDSVMILISMTCCYNFKRNGRGLYLAFIVGLLVLTLLQSRNQCLLPLEPEHYLVHLLGSIQTMEMRV
uniref:Uncharacterized protein n=1 Tax=Amphimedon queenslandica TaxID=400682 RepID=A0A1X7T4K7_AMPQE